jgi:hypothetical protein
MSAQPRTRRRTTPATLPYRLEFEYAPDRTRCLAGLRLAFDLKPRPPFPDPPPTPPSAAPAATRSHSIQRRRRRAIGKEAAA